MIPNSLAKLAARAAMRHIKNLVSQNNFARANAVAKTPGVLKPVTNMAGEIAGGAAGSQIKHLGRGAEGLATLVAHPQHGISVRKLYDPQGMSTPAMIQRKEQVGRALGNNSDFARFYGSSPTLHGQGTMHFSEYIPTGQMPQGANQAQSVRSTASRAQSAINDVGYEGHDIRSGNMIYDSRSGSHRVVDYVPTKPGEVRSPSPGVLEVTPKGYHLFGGSTFGGKETPTETMLGGMLGGKTVYGRPPNIANGSNTVVNQSDPTVPIKTQSPPGQSQQAATNIIRKPKAALPVQNNIKTKVI